MNQAGPAGLDSDRGTRGKRDCQTLPCLLAQRWVPEAACADPAPGSVILLENVRYHVEEEGKGEGLARLDELRRMTEG